MRYVIRVRRGVGVWFYYLVGFMMGAFVGYVVAYGKVSNECKLLNSFYVGHGIFECKQVNL